MSDTTLYLLLDVLSLLSHILRLSPDNAALVSKIIMDDDGNCLLWIWCLEFQDLEYQLFFKVAFVV